MRSLVLVSALLAVCCLSSAATLQKPHLGYPAHSSHNLEPYGINEQLRNLTEQLREKLKTGIPELNIPSCDPLIIENNNFAFDSDLINLNLTLRDTKVDGIVDFVVNVIKFSIAGLRFEYDVVLPVLALKGKYETNSTLVSLVPIWGQGDADLSLKNLSVSGKGKIGSQNGTIFLEEFNILVALENIDVKITGLAENEDLSALLSTVISENLPGALEHFSQDIDTAISTQVFELVNGLLEGKTIDDLLKWIRGEGNF